MNKSIESEQYGSDLYGDVFVSLMADEYGVSESEVRELIDQGNGEPGADSLSDNRFATDSKQPDTPKGHRLDSYLPVDIDISSTKPHDNPVVATLNLGSEENNPSRLMQIVDLRGTSVGRNGARHYGNTDYAPDVDFLLIQPSVYDSSKGRSGFKGIRLGERVDVGRDTPTSDRFDFDDGVSRHHLSVEFAVDKDGPGEVAPKLRVTDLNSSNGTYLVEGFEHERQERTERVRSLIGGLGIDAQNPIMDKKDGVSRVTEVRSMETAEVDDFWKFLKESDSSQSTSLKRLKQLEYARPTSGVEIDGRLFYLSDPQCDPSDTKRPYIMGYTRSDIEPNNWVPRLFYKSSSDGGWRLTPQITMNARGSAHLDKGMGLIDRQDDIVYYSAYTAVTKLTDGLDDAIRSKIADHKPVMQSHLMSDMAKVYSGQDFYEQTDEYITPECVKVDDSEGLDLLLPGKGVNIFGHGTNNLQEYNDLHEASRARLENIKLPDGFEPDFAHQNPNKMYKTEHTLYGDVTVRVYSATYKGEPIEWYMHSDREGRVWVDKVTFVNGQQTSYGTEKRVIAGGALNCKPAEYAQQFGVTTGAAEEGADFEYLSDDYVDTSPTLDRLPWIRNFRKAIAGTTVRSEWAKNRLYIE